MATDLNPQLLVARSTNPAIDTASAVTSGGRQGEVRQLAYGSTRHHLADEGTYYVGTLTPAGTTFSFFSNISTFNKTVMSVMFQNRAKAQGFSRVFFDYFRITWAGASTSGTSAWCSFATDNLNMPNNTDINLAIAPKATPVNLDASFDNPLFVYYSGSNALGVNAVTSAWSPVTGRLQMKGANYAAGDEFVVSFGARGSSRGFAPVNANGRFTAFVGPVAIGPQQQLEFRLVVPGSSGQGLCEVDYGFWIR